MSFQSIRKVYFLGIGGIGMGGLALALKKQGYDVSGADRSIIYDPMRLFLEREQISYVCEWDLDHIRAFEPDFVVIGNVCSQENSIVKWVLSEKIPFEHMAGFVGKWASSVAPADRQVVITGTHGKTTTSTLIRDICNLNGLETGSFIGGFNGEQSLGVQLPKRADVFVIEGDEYDCSFYDKQPKFMYYRGAHAVLNACEHDHVDIYPSEKHMALAYQAWIKMLPQNGCLWVSESVLQGNIWQQYLQDSVREDVNLKTYGASESCDYNFYSERSGHVRIQDGSGKLLGEHERLVIPTEGFYQSVCLAYGIGQALELDLAQIHKGIEGFTGVLRRHRILREQGLVVIDDFAHHPTAVGMNLRALKRRYPDRRVCAIFEPRSATSRRNAFHQQWRKALSQADLALIAPVFQPQAIQDHERLDVLQLSADIREEGKSSFGARSHEELVTCVAEEAKKDDVWVLFSNGPLPEMENVLLNHPAS